MLIQCTQKLLKQLNIKPAEVEYGDPLFSCHANLMMVNRRKAVVFVNDKNRYVIVLYGLKTKDFKKLDELFIKAVREVLENECIKNYFIEQFINYSPKIVYSKTRDRKSVARMNKSCEAVYYYADFLTADSIYQSALSKKLGRYLVGNGKNNFITPVEEMYKDLENFFRKPIFSCKAVQLKITLELCKHKVWRRLVVPLNITFDRLHKVLQKLFGWKDYHLHEFYIYDSTSFCSKLSINDSAYNEHSYNPIIKLVCDEEAFEYPDDIQTKLETGIKLSEYIPRYKWLKYDYDFGDNWQHYIEVEKVIDDYNLNYPVCVDGNGKAPPEDVGGDPGYEEFLGILRDKNNPEYDNMLAWGSGQGYEDFDIEAINSKIRYI
ncbi:plasmid pRiA4b ORF-3 family protein [Clostridium sp. Mt-5]|uniref:Plasmid pRiA4b ORF-3 family protein n=1 Tax=Clostridium moutaii TaxID=3240932 RepID=A0ABV4BP00_9CLOT